MIISITAVVDRKLRAFSKALVKHSEALAAIRNAIIYKNSEMLPFDTFQVVLLERSPDYVHPIGCKKDRLFQVEVALPNANLVDYSNEKEFVAAIAEQVIKALGVSGLPQDHLAEIENSIEEAIGGR